MKVVVDASAVVAVLLRTPEAEKIESHLAEARGNIHAPHLLDIEITQLLHHLVVMDPSQSKRCLQALQDLREMPVFRHAHYPFLDRVWQLHKQHSVPGATYLALAECLAASLVTCDDRIISLSSHLAIEILS